jgi:peptidoglycan/xylan/chitin deacetylase (PgdA/CDA1 family)
VLPGAVLMQAPRFLVCVHDATPAFARATESIVRGLAPLVGARLSFGVVPDWHGRWPLASHPGFCELLRESSEELLLHGFHHQRRTGMGPVSVLAGRCDEMNGLDVDRTHQLIASGQRAFTAAFGAPATGFLAPAWQRGHVRASASLGISHVLGFFSLQPANDAAIPLATSTWDCGRWGLLGHVGDGIGRVSLALTRRVPVIAIHPRDMERGFWPRILGLTRALLERGYEPATPRAVIAARC